MESRIVIEKYTRNKDKFVEGYEIKIITMIKYLKTIQNS